MSKNKKVSVLAFEKKLVPSDGYLYGTSWENRKTQSSPLSLTEKSVRGTISNRLSNALRGDPAKLDAEVGKPNLQRVDSCALSIEQDTLKMVFTLKILSGVEYPSACNHDEFNKSYFSIAKNYIQKYGFQELAVRYAINIANGRFLWRNRVGTEQVEVEVELTNSNQNKTWSFNASSLSIRNFKEANRTDDIKELSYFIAEALSGKTDFLLLKITAFALIGKAQDVYPSEELILDKNNSKTKKSKVLYEVDQIAAIHSQKIGNALRTIDTWYPSDDISHIGPIAIEPYGAVTNRGIAYRNPKNKSDFYTLFDQYAWGNSLSTEEEHYVMGVLLRGGVFGESDK